MKLKNIVIMKNIMKSIYLIIYLTAIYVKNNKYEIAK